MANLKDYFSKRIPIFCVFKKTIYLQMKELFDSIVMQIAGNSTKSLFLNRLSQTDKNLK